MVEHHICDDDQYGTHTEHQPGSKKPSLDPTNYQCSRYKNPRHRRADEPSDNDNKGNLDLFWAKGFSLRLLSITQLLPSICQLPKGYTEDCHDRRAPQ